MLATALSYIAAFIRTYLHQICFGITAVTLMLAGPHINAVIRSLVKKLHWVVRYAVFILVCTAGYVFLAQFLYQTVLRLLRGCTSGMLVAATAGIFLFLAWIAKEQRAI